MRELGTLHDEVQNRGCHICAQTFSTQEDLAKHLIKAHGGREPVTGSG